MIFVGIFHDKNLLLCLKRKTPNGKFHFFKRFKMEGV